MDIPFLPSAEEELSGRLTITRARFRDWGRSGCGKVAVQRIAAFPQYGNPHVETGTGRAMLRRFPFSLV